MYYYCTFVVLLPLLVVVHYHDNNIDNMYIIITTTYTRHIQSTNNMQLGVSAQQSHRGEPQCSTSSSPGACFLGAVLHSVLAAPCLCLHPNEATCLRVSALGERVGQSSRCVLCGCRGNERHEWRWLCIGGLLSPRFEGDMGIQLYMQ